MKTLIALSVLALVPSLSFAAPSGQRTCHDKENKVEVSFGTYALEGPPVKITIGNMHYLLEAEFGAQGAVYTNKTYGAMCICEAADGPRVGSGLVKVLGDDNITEASKISLTLYLTIPGATPVVCASYQELELSCEETDFRPGNEQN
jgi:hypothetical protein